MKTRRTNRNARTHGAKWVIALILALIALVLVVGAASIVKSVQEWTADLPSVSGAQDYVNSSRTTIYANDRKTVLAEFYLQDQQATTIDKVSKYVLEGTVATEDSRFYEHNGVDPTGIARALLNNFMGGDLEGASTITQQLVRNTLLANEASDISFKRKVREADLALQMEKQYSKDEILMMYLNTINYGSGCYGIEAAAQHYYSKSAKDLTIAESATLIGIPQSPTYNNPENYPSNCIERRNTVLDRMLSYGCITQAEHDAAQAENLNLDISTRESDDGIYLFPYFTSYVRETLVEKLSYEAVYSGGLTVYTTIDPTLQNYADQVTQDMFATLDSDITMALTCVDPKTGYILAMVGGRDYYTKQYSMATSETGRQAGSSFKPFTLTAAIEQGISPLTTMDCTSPYTYNGWTVENYDNYNYGTRSLASATWVSSNTGYARLVTEENGVAPSSVVEMAARLGVTGTSGFGAFPSITLGVSQVNTTKMAGAYATYANDGMHYDTSCIIEVRDNNGKTLIDNTNPVGTQVITHEVSYAVTQVLQGVVKYGTATEVVLTNGQTVAGKTGTSENHRDLWFCGYTPQYSCAVWAGADPEREMYEASWSKVVWKNFMNLALQGKKAEDFNTYDSPTYDSKYTSSHGTTWTSGISNSSSSSSYYNSNYYYGYNSNYNSDSSSSSASSSSSSGTSSSTYADTSSSDSTSQDASSSPDSTASPPG